jgi:hypothetical protein
VSPSITYWNRLEPSPRSNDLVQSLGAGVADGVWVLTRQWQLGEFEGADAGSPAWIEVDTTTRRMTAWRAGDASGPIEPHIPLDDTIGERLPLDLETRVDLGQMFESMLIAANLAAEIPTFRADYPIAAATAAEKVSGDIELLRLRELVAGRGIDGGALYEAAAQWPTNPSPIPHLVQQYAKAVHDYFGGAPAAPSPAWNPKQLAYQFDVSAGDAGGFAVRPGDDSAVTWDAFSSSDFIATADAEPPLEERFTLLPAGVRQRRMPSGPWWNFDHAAADAGAIDVERRDLAKLVLMDVLLVQGGDWYVIPLEQQIGTVMHLDAVCVRDVFGLLTIIPPAAGDQGPWSMFTTSGPSSALGFLLPADSSAATQHGRPIEEVRFIRDEMLNMVWALEETIEGGTGRSLSAYDRATVRAAADDVAVPSFHGETVPRYVLRTAGPEQRIPFIPAIRGVEGALLERARDGATGIITAAPAIAEEELRRSGLRMRRVPARSRGARGETLLHIAYIKDVNASNDSPAPRFDALVPGTGSGLLPLTVSGQVTLIQSTFGTQGNFEVVVPLDSGGLAHYSRDNDAEGFPWLALSVFATDAGKVEAVSLIQSTFFDNFEIVVRIDDRLAHFWRDASSGEWFGPNFFASGVSGTVSLIQGRFGAAGNFEVVAPLAAGGIAHFWRDNQTFDWSDANVFAEDVGKVDEVCLIQGSFGDNFELVARIGDQLAHFWRDGVSNLWSGAAFFASGISGTPSFVQNRTGSGNFEVVAPLSGGGLGHFYRDNAALDQPWYGPARFGEGTIRAAALIQSNFGDNLELVALTAGSLVHYWRESTSPFPWHGPEPIT